MKLFEIGKIVNTQGVKGEVRVMPTTDSPDRFELLDSVEVHFINEVKKLTIENVRYHKQFVIIKFKEIEDMTQAEKLKNSVIKITEEKALPLADDEYYIQDLYDLTVVENGVSLGVLTDILVTGANDVYVVKTSDNKEILIPAIKQCILNVDLDNKIMTVKLLEGLVE